LAVLGHLVQGGPGAPAAGAALEDVAVVQEAIEHGGDRGGVGEEATPVFDGAVGCDSERKRVTRSGAVEVGDGSGRGWGIALGTCAATEPATAPPPPERRSPRFRKR
jgi:hypothetical protein